jgi:hypothetical protein
VSIGQLTREAQKTRVKNVFVWKDLRLRLLYDGEVYEDACIVHSSMRTHILRLRLLYDGERSPIYVSSYY